jgi:hypothetical protein
MPSPSSAVVFWGVPYGAATSIAVGNLVLPADSGGYVVATSGNRTLYSRRAEGVAVTTSSGSGLGSIEIWQTGTIDASVSGLGVGTASWVRCSTTGSIERFTPVAAGTSDVIGKCDASGRVRLEFGVWTEDLAIGGGSGGAAAHVAGGPGDIQTRAAIGGDLAAAANWSFTPDPSNGRLFVGYDLGFFPVKGAISVYAATAGTETPASAVPSLPGDGFIQLSYFTADGPFHGDNFTVVSYLASTENTAASGFSVGAMGVSGGVPFFGDPSHLTETNVYGDGIFIDAGAGTGGTGTHPLTSWTGEIRLQCKAATSAGGFSVTGVSFQNGAPLPGVASFDTGSPRRLRTSIGTSLQVLRTNAGGTDIEWAAAGGSSTGASGTVQLSDGAGGFSAATNVLGGTSILSIGTTPSSTGNLRFSNVTTAHARVAANNADFSIWETDSSNNLYFGVDAAFGGSLYANTVRVAAATSIITGIGGARQIEMNGSNVMMGKPVIGGNLASSPWSGCNGTVSQAMLNTDQTLAATSYANTCILTSGAITANRTLTFPSATDAQGYMKWLNNTCTGAFGIIASTGAGTTITVANGKSAFIWVDSRGVTRMTADV